MLNNNAKSVVIFSDIHDGSNYAVCTKKPKRTDANPHEPSKAQRALLDAWKSSIKSITRKPTLVVINGEPIDGPNRRSVGAGQWSTNTVDQLRDAEKLLRMIPGHENIVFTRGSGYHVDLDGGATPLEELMADRMDAKSARAYGGDGKTDFEFNMEIHGKYFNFTHHVGFRNWFMYRPTAIAIELAKMHFEHGRRGFHADILVRSHVHYYCEVRFPNTLGFTTPAWKFPDGFMYRRGQPTLPDVGCIEVLVETNGKIHVEPHLTEVNFKPRVSHF